MSEHYTLMAQERDRAGKGVARALRRENLIPAVIYGDKQAPVSVSLPEKETTLEYKKGHMATSLCDLNVAGKKHLVIVRDVQTHPVSDKIIHVDFLRVSEKTTIRVPVPIHFLNQDASPGLKQGGVLNMAMHEITVECSANAMPASLDFDLTGKNIGDAIHMSETKLPAKVTIVGHDEDFTIATIMAPKVQIETDDTAAAPAAGAVPATNVSSDKE
ncbi:MAG: 50S ribosomal protein L25/general stress protein Ctc [Pseudomonadota bacterium]